MSEKPVLSELYPIENPQILYSKQLQTSKSPDEFENR